MQIAVVNPSKKGRGRKSRKSGGRRRKATRKASRKTGGRRRKAAKPRKSRRRAARPRVTSSVGRRRASISIRYANKRRRRSYTANPRRRRRRATNPRRRRNYRRRANPRRRAYRRRNPSLKSIGKGLFIAAPRRGYKWGFKDVPGLIGGGVTTSMVSGLAKMQTGQEVAGPVAGSIYVVTSSFVLAKWKVTRGIATGWFVGGVIAVVIDVIATLIRVAAQKPLKGLSGDELAAMEPLDKAATLLQKGVSDIQEVVKGALKSDESYSADEYVKSETIYDPTLAGEGGQLPGRGWMSDIVGDFEVSAARSLAMGEFNDEWRKFLRLPGASGDELAADFV